MNTILVSGWLKDCENVILCKIPIVPIHSCLVLQKSETVTKNVFTYKLSLHVFRPRITTPLKHLLRLGKIKNLWNKNIF